jgi:Hint domain
MKRFNYLMVICLVTLLAACSPAGQEMTGVVSTAITGTAEVVVITQLPPDYTPPPVEPPPAPTAIPTLPGGLSPIELKYRLLDEYPDFFFCDPDFYPVARDDELALALQRFPELQANPEEFNAILEHNRLAGQTTITEEQKLQIYQDHKRLAAIPLVLSGDVYQFQIKVAKTEGKGELISGEIDAQGKITVEKREPSFASCPICLAAGTLIDTPGGSIPVQDLRAGDQVWTVDGSGERVAQPALRVSQTPVPANHRVVHLVLQDGRELWVSPGHPTADGRTVGALQVGDTLDGAGVISVQREPYTRLVTYDLLPAGGTGFYWANGILIASTLKGGLE